MTKGVPLNEDICQIIVKYIQEGKSRYFIAEALKLTVKWAVQNYILEVSQNAVATIVTRGMYKMIFYRQAPRL